MAALLGLYIMYTAISEGSDRPWLYAAALMMMGLPGARAFETLIGGLGRVLDALKASEQSRPKPPPPRRRKDGE